MIDYDFNTPIPQGWQCPACKRVYSPSYPWCNFCGNDRTETKDTYTYDYYKAGTGAVHIPPPVTVE